MEKIKSFTSTVDKFQQTHTFLAFPIAVVKRYGDDKAGRQAALVTYYAFLSVFPLLIIFLTVLGVIAATSTTLETRILHNVYQLVPDLGSNLRKSVHSLRGSGLGLILQLLVLFYGTRGLASILQETFNNLWHVPKEHRPGFWGDHLRGFSMMLAVGLGIVLGTAISVGLGSIIHLGFVGEAFITLLNVFVTFCLFLAVFRLGTSESIPLRKLILGAIIATIGMIIIQRLGGYIMSRQLPKLEGAYGSFSVALGLLFWIYLQAQVILYALVITIVRTERDWPKKLF